MKLWSSIVIVHEKSGFMLFFFKISQKQLKLLYFDKKKKIGRNHSISVYKKFLISEHQKNYIFRDINYFVKMSVSLLVSLLIIVSLYVTNFCGRASSKTSA